MTHQFKFGDRVRYKSPESKLRGFVASTRNRGQNKIIVAFEGEDWLHHCSGENLELIPHPDTVRLDWLLKNDCALTERLCDEDGDILETPNAVIQKQEDHFEVLAATSNDIREAIDVAMAYIDSKR